HGRAAARARSRGRWTALRHGPRRCNRDGAGGGGGGTHATWARRARRLLGGGRPTRDGRVVRGADPPSTSADPRPTRVRPGRRRAGRIHRRRIGRHPRAGRRVLPGRSRPGGRLDRVGRERERVMAGPRVALHTLGCKVNTYDAATIADRLRAAGCEIVATDAPADVVIVN